MTSSTADDAKVRYVAAMGERLGEQFHTIGGALALLQVLDDGVRSEAKRRERIARSEWSEDDYRITGDCFWMSDQTVTLELLGARLLALTAQVHDLEQRFAGLEARFDGFEVRLGGIENRLSALEGRFSAMERRYAVQEERMSRMLSLIVRIAERQGVGE